MRLLKGLAGSLLWIVAGLLGLVSIILCVTIILLPLGIPLLGLARRLMTTGVRLMLPRSVAHPVKQSKKGLWGRRAELQDRVADAAADTAKKGKRGKKSAKAVVSKVATSTTHRRGTLRKRFS